MRALLQRVRMARVEIDGQIVADIGRGLLVFWGACKGDTETDVPILAEKVASLRVFEDSDHKMNLSIHETAGEILVVSQFTLYGDTSKGRRPSFTQALEPTQSLKLYADFVESLRATGLIVRTGVFGAKMVVILENDGPVTLLLESPLRAGSSARDAHD